VPYRWMTPCRYPRCPGMVVRGGYCSKHARLIGASFDRDRGSAKTRGYGAEWRTIRRNVLAEVTSCQACGNAPATCVDHIIPLSEGGTNERDNLRALCQSCHSRKTAKEDGGYGNKHGVASAEG